MAAETTTLPNTKELIRASEDTLPSLLDKLRGAITGPCHATKQRAMEIIQATVGICSPELPLTKALQSISQVQATTYEGSDYTETHYNF
ncbi:MAG: hypothetical protein AAB383_04710 [Patescibacteria group bacterium]